MTRSKNRLILVGALFFVWASVVLWRLVDVQILDHEEYEARAVRQHESSVELSPLRGSIYDARGRLLAGSAAAPSIYVDPQKIEDPSVLAARLARVPGIGLTEQQLHSRLDRGGEFAWVARQVAGETWDAVEQLELAGVGAIREYRRSYPNGRLGSNVLGLVGIDGDGLGGLEHSLDQFVRGESAVRTLLRDARRDLYLLDTDSTGPIHGYDLILTIDEVVQYLTEEALLRAVSESEALSGTAIVMRPADGGILAMASYPTFDPNSYADYPASNWKNRAVQDVYEPGSTFKMVVAAAGIEEGIVTPSQPIDCGEGFIEVAGTVIREHGGKRYGVISFEEVIANSSNVGTIMVGQALGAEALDRYTRAFGYGAKTGLELPGEARGILRELDQWSGLSTASISIGQELAATPLQVALMTATIANGGVRPVPRIVDRVVTRDGRTVYQPPTVEGRRVVSARTAALTNEMLKSVVAKGTGSRAAVEGYAVAGKTGTAQKSDHNGYSDTKTIASFAGYLPADRPELVIVVMLDEPRSSQYGGEVAAPAFAEIASGAMKYLRVGHETPNRRSLEVPVSGRGSRIAKRLSRRSRGGFS